MHKRLLDVFALVPFALSRLKDLGESKAMRGAIGVVVAMGFSIGAVQAYEADQVMITRVDSFNTSGHMWFVISGNSNCATPTGYFIIQSWYDQSEPAKTQRQVMYQMALTALAAGKQIRVVGGSCYLNQYLFADQIMIYD